MYFKNLLKLSTITSLIFLMSCNSTLNSASQQPTNPINPQKGSTPVVDPAPSLADQINKAQYNGFTVNSNSGVSWTEGNVVMNLDLINKLLVVRIPLGFLITMTPSDLLVPNVSGITWTIESDITKGQFLVVSIALPHVLQDYVHGAPALLPNGDPLPSVPAGETRQVAHFQLSLSKKGSEKVHLYFGKEYYAVFLESGVKLLPKTIYMASVQIRNKDKSKVIGYLHVINKKNGYNGGVMMAFQMPPSLAVLLDNLIKE